MIDAEYDYLFRDADPRWKAYYRTQREEYRKKHPRTNFEKWRDSLTPEALLSKRSDDTKCVYIDCAPNCPAENCPAKECWIIHPARLERWAHYAKQCDKWFLRWANAPAKEEGK